MADKDLMCSVQQNSGKDSEFSDSKPSGFENLKTLVLREKTYI